MTTQEKRNYILGTLRMAKGDDLERANLAFGHMSDKELDHQWGQSGKTCRQVWQEYKDDRARNQEVTEWIKELMEKVTL